MNEEITNLTQAQTWELTTKPLGVRIISSRWLFRKKKDEAGKRAKFKARLVAKGYLQVPGVDFQDTFSPVIKLKSIRLLLAIVAEKDFEIHQLDITAAYLNGVLEEDLYTWLSQRVALKKEKITLSAT
ncbi:Retrovirus-related Pol polyprotein from transposon RE1 [Araneus ventricosus]|uniref:Retrovirus-related Pol polyprotein from transposon RE1 n=1 Tax=Araneus ventricosus TaxID=182803 RepID=A0A4Y2P064_ARAVE|nr:Retrovirus-related Pol polyprotein from transposon RE1 [Araneus ventricosus]